jgi:hypothetical protein
MSVHEQKNISKKRAVAVVVVLLFLLAVVLVRTRIHDQPAKAPPPTTFIQEGESLNKQSPPCFTPQHCEVPFDGLVAGALGIGSETEFYLGGKRIKPQAVKYTISYDTYVDEVITDSIGTVLTSSRKTYDPVTRVLLIEVGLSKKYVLELDASQVRTLYLSQLVRSLFSLQQKKTNDYVAVYEVVNRLSDWQPNTVL